VSSLGGGGISIAQPCHEGGGGNKEPIVGRKASDEGCMNVLGLRGPSLKDVRRLHKTEEGIG